MAAFGLGQSREEINVGHWELRELVWRQATQRLTQRSISLPLGTPRGIREKVEDLPLDRG